MEKTGCTPGKSSSLHSRILQKQAKSPNFTLPPKESSTDIIKWSLCTWELLPYVENKDRSILVTCSTCSNVWSDRWPIETSIYKAHYWQHHETQLLKWKEQAEMAMKSGRKVDKTILSSDIFENRVFLPTSKQSRRAVTVSVSTVDEPAAKRSRPNMFSDREIRDSLLNLILEENLSFSIVESAAFRRFSKSLNYYAPEVPLDIVRDDLDAFFDRTTLSMKSLFGQHDGRFALTVNEWRSCKDYDFFAVTLHYLSHDFQLEKCTIGFEVLDKDVSYTSNCRYGKYTSNVLCGKFSKILSDFGIKDRIVSLTRDNSPPLNTLYQSFYKEKFDSGVGIWFHGDVGSINHVLSVATDAFLRYSFFKTSTSIRFDRILEDMRGNHLNFEKMKQKMKVLPRTIRSIALRLRRNNKIKELFRQSTHKRSSAKVLKKGPKRRKNDTSTRWLSTYDMITEFLSFRPKVTELLKEARETGDIDEYKLAAYEVSDDQWDVLNDIRSILEIFEGPTVDFQTSKFGNVSLIIPYVCDMVNQLDAILSTKDSNGANLKQRNPFLASGVSEARAKILEYYPIRSENVRPLETLYLATVLDPRFKLGLLEDLGISSSIIEGVKKRFRFVCNEYCSNCLMKEYELKRDTEEKDSAQGECLWKGIKEKWYVPERATRHEVDIYLSETRADENTDLKEYFHERKEYLPTISRMAKDYLAIPVVSVQTEMLFSEMEVTMKKNGYRLSPDMISKLAILKSQSFLDPKELDNVGESRYSVQRPTKEGLQDPSITLDEINESDEDDIAKICKDVGAVVLSENPFQG